MNITLRKAKAIQTAITEAVRGIDITTTVTVNEFQEPAHIIAEAHRTLFENDRRRALLTTVLYNIRGLVGQANHESGINLLLSQAAFAEKRIQQLEELSRNKEATDIEVIKGRLDKIKATKEDHRIYGRDEISTGILNKADLEKLRKEVAEIKKQKQKYTDEILELNIKTEVPLSEEAVKILQAEGIV